MENEKWKISCYARVDCSIRKLPGQSLTAAHRHLSQPITSFIGVLYQGIHWMHKIKPKSNQPKLQRNLSWSNSTQLHKDKNIRPIGRVWWNQDFCSFSLQFQLLRYSTYLVNTKIQFSGLVTWESQTILK